jgi:hypothetical protein
MTISGKKRSSGSRPVKAAGHRQDLDVHHATIAGLAA